MSVFPKINLDIPETVREFITVLHAIDTKLDALIELTEESNRNSVMDRLGRTTRERQAWDRAIDAAHDRQHPEPGPEIANHVEHCTAPTCCVQAVATCPVNPTDADLDPRR